MSSCSRQDSGQHYLLSRVTIPGFPSELSHLPLDWNLKFVFEARQEPGALGADLPVMEVNVPPPEEGPRGLNHAFLGFDLALW